MCTCMQQQLTHSFQAQSGYHQLRMLHAFTFHLQTVQQKLLSTSVLNPSEWGWKLHNGRHLHQSASLWQGQVQLVLWSTQCWLTTRARHYSSGSWYNSISTWCQQSHGSISIFYHKWNGGQHRASDKQRSQMSNKEPGMKVTQHSSAVIGNRWILRKSGLSPSYGQKERADLSLWQPCPEADLLTQ